MTVTDQGLHAMSSLHALTFLDLSRCKLMTDEALQGVSPPCAHVSQPLLVRRGHGPGVRALNSLPALASLDLPFCHTVTAAGVQALRSTAAAPILRIEQL